MADIAWIGTGIMGSRMCRRLIQAGHSVRVHNRTVSKARLLADAGATLASTVEEAVKNVEFVFTMLGYPSDVEDVYLGPAGVMESVKENAVLVDMTTSSPTLAIRVANAARTHSAWAIDAPVSGGDIGAETGRLAVMVGGEEESFQRVLPILNILGARVSLMGGPGSGQHTKAANQILLAATLEGVVEALLYVKTAGLDQKSFVDAVQDGAASSWLLKNRSGKMIKGDFAPGFFVKHFVKDMGIALAEAKEAGLALPSLAQIHQEYIAAMGRGLSESGNLVLYKIVADQSGIASTL